MEEELSNLIKKLNAETTFVQSEKKHIIDLYRQVLKKSEQLFQKQWIIGRQQMLIDDLVFGRTPLIASHQKSTHTTQSKLVSTKYSQLNTNVQFVESHKIFSHNDYYISECFKQLRDNPTSLASYLAKNEHKLNQFNLDASLVTNQQIIPILFQSLYGNCVLVQDELFCLQLLKTLIELQFTQRSSATLKLNDLFTNNIDLRKLIRKKTCSFNQLFKLYTSFAHSTQLFLSTALREPITQILTDEWYLDIDADKALGRFGHDELVAHFGQKDSKEYKLKTLKYREKIVNQLHQIACTFIESISSNLYCFPASLAWLCNQLYFHVSRTTGDSDLARKLCCDLVMTLFICPAICDPEPYGIIVDIQISSVARHNLMQIANILQVLAMSDDDKDLKAQDLYCKFRNNCVSDILNSIIAPNIRNCNQLISTEQTPTTSSTTNGSHLFAFDPIQSTFQTMFTAATNTNSNATNEVISSSASVASSSTSLASTTSLLTRTSMIISLQDAHKLLIYLKQTLKELPPDSEDYKWLKSILPSEYLNNQLEQTALSLNTKPSVSSTLTRRQSDQNLVSLANYTSESSEVINALLKEPDSVDDYKVLIVNINDKSMECPGMMSEDKIIKEYELNMMNKKPVLLNGAKVSSVSKRINTNNVSIDSTGTYESSRAINKVPSFGMMIIDRDDMNSVEGGISEACETNRSISSNDSDDNNDKNDDDKNLSDFDNFSGRDTPIISGHDTSSSHSQEDLHNITSTSNQLRPSMSNISTQRVHNNHVINNSISQSSLASNIRNIPVTVQKANREDINDKFCKFEISKTNQPVKEEQLSEAWSLDADPPESVINDPLEDSSVNSRINSSSSISTNAVNANLLINANSSTKNEINLIGFDDQEPKSTLKSTNNDLIALNGGGGNELTASSNGTPDLLINPAVPTTLNETTSDLNDLNNLDDKYSVISDSAAWSNDLVTNSDSDLESNSPSKYTSYSRTSNTFQKSDFSSSSTFYNQQQQQTVSSLPPSNLNNYSNSNNLAASFAADFIKNSAKSIDSGLLDSWHYSAESENLKPTSTTANLPPTPQTQLSSANSKSRLKSIFSNSNSSGVKFSLKSSNSTTNNNAKSRGGLHKIFSIHKNKTESNNSVGAANPVLNTPSNSNEQSNLTTSTDNQSDNIDNILKKYSTNPPSSSNANNSKNTNATEAVLIDLSMPPTNSDLLNKNYQLNQTSDLLLGNMAVSTFDSSSVNLEQAKQFIDAKKKIRNVFSWSDSFNFLPISTHKNSKENFLRMYLKTQLFEAISNQEKDKEAQLYETIRCVSIFSDKDCRKLLRSLKSDYIKRMPYVTYLTKSKQNILHSINQIDKLQQRAKWYQLICNHNLTSVITRTFLDEREKQITQFVLNFRQLATVDEKFDLFKQLIKLFKQDFNQIWSDCDTDLIELSCICLERLIIPKVYRFAMYPNGEIDHFRDSKVFECFNELAQIITPAHPLIGIPQIYENECPWHAAQIELRRINIYKSPQDKLACIRKCLLTIQNLLGMAKSPVCADDLHPVLIYVIIKANPPTFLSNVQYVEGYYGKQLESEDYYWAQFIFAFSYIKANMLSSILN